MRIAIAQINTVPGVFGPTVDRMVAQSARAVEQGADLVVFPLAALAGVEPLSPSDRLSYLSDVASAVTELSSRLACAAIVPAQFGLSGQEMGFDALLIDQGEARPIGLPLPLRFSDTQRAGTDPDVAQFEFGGKRFALAFTYEDLDAIEDFDYDVDVTLFLSSYPYAMDDPSSAMGSALEAGRYIEDACVTQTWVVGVAPVGGYGEQVFGGSSFAVSPKGNLVASLPAFEEALQVVEIDGELEMGAESSFAPELYDAPLHLWQMVSLGIHDFVTKRGATDVALVLDTSLASHVLLALASDALGPLHVHALVGARAGSEAPACRELARRLHVHQVDGIGRLGDYDAYDLDEIGVAALAREYQAVVLSSLDKTALALGTTAGHVSAGMLLPLGDVFRSDVLEMAHVRNTISPLFRRVALGEADRVVLAREDGSMLRFGDEAEMDRLDEILLGYIEYERSLASLINKDGLDGEAADVVLRAVRKAELVRRSSAPLLIMSTHPLSDLRFPLGNPWHDEHREELSGLSFLQGAPPQADDGEDALAQESAEREGQDGPDLEGTLAMLRDLFEQGGFMPQHMGEDEGEGPSGHDGLHDGHPGFWGSIFSEN